MTSVITARAPMRMRRVDSLMSASEAPATRLRSMTTSGVACLAEVVARCSCMRTRRSVPPASSRALCPCARINARQLVERLRARRTRNAVTQAPSRALACSHIGRASSLAAGTWMRSYIWSNLSAMSAREYLPVFAKPEHQVDVRFEKAQAVGGLHEVRVGRAAPFVHANQRLDVVG